MWQYNSYAISDGWGNTYTFSENGKFVYRPSQYQALKAVLAIIGEYRIEIDKILLTVTSITELIGGQIEYDV